MRIGCPRSIRKHLAVIAAYLSKEGWPWVLAGDWNATPRQLANSAWLDKVKGRVLRPSNVEVTCLSGQAIMLDYAVVGPGHNGLIKGLTGEAKLWTSHLALHLTIKRVNGGDEG